MSDLYGTPNSIVGITLQVEPMGPVQVVIGTNIVGIVGEALKGPIGVAVGMKDPAYARRLYGAGDLYEAAGVAFSQGAGTVYCVRVGPADAVTAHAHLTDGDTPGVEVATLNYRGEGIAGNSTVYEIRAGTLNATDVERIKGDGTVGPYALDVWDIVEATTNSIKVGAAAKTIVYAQGDLAAGKVFVDKTKGEYTFYTGEAPTSADLITVSLAYKTRRIIIIDENGIQEDFDNIRSLVDMQSQLDQSLICELVPVTGQTHLPETCSPTALADGADGTTISTTHYLDALDALGEEITPTTVALTAYEVAAGTYDLVPVAEGWSTNMARQLKPCMVFVPTKMMETKENLENLAAGYNNRHFCIEGNSWDCSAVAKNLAVARAAKEAALPMGESAAYAGNSMSGIDGLLKIFRDTEVDHLTRAGVDICIMKGAVGAPRGIRPYLGITTSTEWQFSRCVDNRTINYIILAVKYITDQYYHRRRSARVLSSCKASIVGLLQEQKEWGNIEGYAVEVKAPANDLGRVDVDLQLQCIGHIERFHVLLQVGIMSNYVGFAA